MMSWEDTGRFEGYSVGERCCLWVRHLLMFEEWLDWKGAWNYSVMDVTMWAQALVKRYIDWRRARRGP